MPAAKKTVTTRKSPTKTASKTAKAAPKREAARKPATPRTRAKSPVKAAAQTSSRKKVVKRPTAHKVAPAGSRPGSGNVMDEILGQITRLMMASPKHRHMFLSDMELQVIPPLRLGQCRVLRREDGQPLAYAAWARVSDDVHARLESGNHRLKPQDWNSGPHPWLIDIAAPPQALPMVLAELEKNVFKGEKVRTLMAASQNKTEGGGGDDAIFS